MIGCFCRFLFYFRVHREMYRSTKGRCNWLMRELMFSEDKFGFDESLAEEEDIIHSLSPYTTSNSKVWFINIWSWNTQKKELENFSPFVKYLQIIKIRFSNEQFFSVLFAKLLLVWQNFFASSPSSTSANESGTNVSLSHVSRDFCNVRKSFVTVKYFCFKKILLN